MNHFSYYGITNSILHDSLNYLSTVSSRNISRNDTDKSITLNSSGGNISFNYTLTTLNSIFLRVKAKLNNRYSYLNISIGDSVSLSASGNKINNQIEYIDEHEYSFIVYKNNSETKILIFDETNRNYSTLNTQIGTSNEIEITGKYVSIYDIFADSERRYSKETIVNICRNKLQLFKINGAAELNGYNFDLSQNDGGNINISDSKTKIPYISLMQLNNEDKLHIESKEQTASIPLYNNNVDLSIKQFLSKQKLTSYYLCKYDTQKIKLVSCLEYNNQNSICYVPNYVGEENIVKLPYHNYADYTVYVNDELIESKPTIYVYTNEYSQKTVRIIKNGDTIPVEFTFYNCESSGEINITYYDFSNCGYADYLLAKGDSNNSITNIIDKMKDSKVNQTYNNIAPRIFKVPFMLGNIVSDEGAIIEHNALIQNITGIMVNSLNNFLYRE